MATPENTLITRAEITSVKVASNLRKVLTLDGDNIEVGDTGPRDVSGLMSMTNLDSGRLILRRRGQHVQLYLVNLVVKAGAPSSIIAMTNARTGTSRMYPPYIAAGKAVAGTGNVTAVAGPGVDVSINNQLGIVLHGVTPGLTYNGSVDWLTAQPWWGSGESLPGVADGDPIGV